MKLRNKNLTFQSCRFCNIGGSFFRADAEEGTYYVCAGCRELKEELRTLLPEGTEEENFPIPLELSFFQRAINYIKGG